MKRINGQCVFPECHRETMGGNPFCYHHWDLIPNFIRATAKAVFTSKAPGEPEITKQRKIISQIRQIEEFKNKRFSQ